MVMALIFFSTANAGVTTNKGIGREISSGAGDCVEVVVGVADIVVDGGGISNTSVIVVIADAGAIAGNIVADRVCDIIQR